MCKLGMISQERVKTEVKLLLSANRKSYLPYLLAQQRMTLSDLEWPFHASRAISAVAELLVFLWFCYKDGCLVLVVANWIEAADIIKSFTVKDQLIWTQGQIDINSGSV